MNGRREHDGSKCLTLLRRCWHHTEVAWEGIEDWQISLIQRHALA